MRGIALCAGLIALLALPPARADGIEVRDARLRAAEDGLVLDADFDLELTPRLAEVVSTGVPLYFRVDFELTRHRWYWFDDVAASKRLLLRLSYHALSRQYRLSTGLLQQSFPSLEEALSVLRRLRNWLVVDRTVTFADTDGGPALEEEQLTRWTRLGILEGAPLPTDAARAPRWDDPSTGSASDRARAYLDANCAHCHNPTGAARTTGLLLGRHVTDPYTFGACKSPVAAGKATGSLSYDVVPGAPEQSILVHRMRATEPSVMMPEIGRSLAHEEAITLVSEWIKALPGGCR